jgi:voltage-gated sodium channel
MASVLVMRQERLDAIERDRAKSRPSLVSSRDRTATKLFHIEEEEERKETCRHQNAVRDLYNTQQVQIAVAGLIFANFFFSAIHTQTNPGEDPEPGSFIYVVEWVFGILFLLELIWNMYGTWWSEFWESGWNWFDFIIVVISLLSLMMKDLPGISVLRLFRAFRVFRLFKRIKSLKLIIDGVLASLPGVANAFIVLGILMGIWSIMGVEFFGEVAPEEFGTFLAAMFTMWQIMTMDSWASSIARKLLFEEGMEFVGGLYFISFVFIAGILMTNVVVAILLEKYLAATHEEKKAELVGGDATVEEQLEECDIAIELLRKILSMRYMEDRPEARKEFEEVLEDRLQEKEMIQKKYIDIERQKIAVAKVKARGRRVSQKVLGLISHESRRSLTREGWLQQESPKTAGRRHSALAIMGSSAENPMRSNSATKVQFKDGSAAGTEIVQQQPNPEKGRKQKGSKASKSRNLPIRKWRGSV